MRTQFYQSAPKHRGQTPPGEGYAETRFMQNRPIWATGRGQQGVSKLRKCGNFTQNRRKESSTADPWRV